MRISEVFKEEIGIGGVVSLLWFKRRGFSVSCVNLGLKLQTQVSRLGQASSLKWFSCLPPIMVLLCLEL